jgi:hypothetical protein
MTNNLFPSFTIVCPFCTSKQSGFLNGPIEFTYAKYWECVNCKGQLAEQKIDIYLEQTVGDIKPKA